MAGRMLFSSICLFLLICGICSDHAERDVENSEQKTKVKVNVPNIFNLMPNLGKLMEDFEKDVLRSDSNSPSQETGSKEPIPEHIHHVKDNYKTLREFVQSALNMGRRGLNTDGLFSLDLRNNGPNTKLDLRSIFGRMSMATKSQKDEMKQIEEPTDAEEPTTEVPLNEYLHDLIEEQAKGMNDFALSVFGPGDERIAVKNTGQKTTVDLSAPPVKVSVDARANNIERYGDLMDTELVEPQDADEAVVELDPETEYLQHVEQLHRNQLLMRGYETDSENSDEVLRQGTSSPLLDMLRPNFRARVNQVQAKVRDPVKKMTEYYYNLSTGKSKISEDNDSFEDYIEDIEKATGTLNENSREQLQRAFEKFKASIENIDFGERIDAGQFIDEPEDNVWLPGRIIDQRDLETAFLNINKDDRPKPGDIMVLAFTLAGVPLKIFMDAEIENPVRYLHKRLTEAGVTLNIPVSSFQDMEPAGSEVLHVGAGNNGKIPTRAMSIIIPKAENIRSYVRRYSKAYNLPSDVERESMKEIAEALRKYTASDDDLSMDAFSERMKENPDKALRDIVRYFRKSSVKPKNPTLEDLFENLN